MRVLIVFVASLLASAATAQFSVHYDIQETLGSSNLGIASAGGGDVNGDGVLDFALGDTQSGSDGAVTVCSGVDDVLIGGDSTGDGHVWVWSLAPTTPVQLHYFAGSTDEHLGRTFAPAGDLDGDDHDDFVIGAIEGGSLTTGRLLPFRLRRRRERVLRLPKSVRSLRSLGNEPR